MATMISPITISWVTVVWSMVAAVCLTLSGLHFFIWWRQREAMNHLLFAVAATATAGVSGCEWWLMHASTPAEFGLAARWIHVPTWVLVLALVGFVRVHLHAGRPWLA